MVEAGGRPAGFRSPARKASIAGLMATRISAWISGVRPGSPEGKAA